ncbi:TFIIB-type zinc ribbon-containing protein [Paracoccus aminophilus]|uniref:Transcription factor zinc-finger domain-containing protein n=1 Tax=Paracoccus aminophilus JCM 7686 TaxID=1367847 RepID=S5YFE6_PARAH|nr:zf-TFIIB domain-containing protein [Paracoccus aminophilus]AGT10203.1 hypothetical protein JCM7686_3167 [Paracoccus aminophilus JCM 7686]
MHCPIDGETLVMSERNGVEIDYCPKCRGVWLDRGELDKILERAAADTAPAPRADAPRADAPRADAPRAELQRQDASQDRRRFEERRDDRRDDPRDDRRDERDDYRRYDDEPRHGKKKRESFLSDLFDF